MLAMKQAVQLHQQDQTQTEVCTTFTRFVQFVKVAVEGLEVLLVHR